MSLNFTPKCGKLQSPLRYILKEAQPGPNESTTLGFHRVKCSVSDCNTGMSLLGWLGVRPTDQVDHNLDLDICFTFSEY